MKSTVREAMRKQFLTRGHLKMIAAASMLADHFAEAVLYRAVYLPLALSSSPKAHAVYQLYTILRGAGRLAFPIFCFFLAEGFVHTRSVKKYALRLFLFALVSEVPFDLCIYGKVFYPQKQNVLWTLLIGLGALSLTHAVRVSDRVRKDWKPFLMLLMSGASAFLAYLLKTDYQWYGVILIVLFYYVSHLSPWTALLGAACLCWRSFEWPSVFSFLLLPFYNGKKGRQKGYSFYLLYPAHMLLFYFLGVLLSS